MLIGQRREQGGEVESSDASIARFAISDRRLLRTLGFLRNLGGSSGDPETPEEPDAPAAE